MLQRGKAASVCLPMIGVATVAAVLLRCQSGRTLNSVLLQSTCPIVARLIGHMSDSTHFCDTTPF